MEDTLRDMRRIIIKNNKSGLNPCFNGRYSQSKKKVRVEDPKTVLILVLMEDTLRAFTVTGYVCRDGLNPCFNGRYSQRVTCGDYVVMHTSLNPCFNGRYSQRVTEVTPVMRKR